MIITLKGADFSASNIGTLSTWRITRSLGKGATYEGVTFVDRGAAFSAIVTLAEGYEVGEAGVSVIMGNVPLSGVHSISGQAITITITSVTGNVLIKVPTVNVNTGEEDEPETPDIPTGETTWYLSHATQMIENGIDIASGAALNTSVGAFAFQDTINNMLINKPINLIRCFVHTAGTFTVYKWNQKEKTLVEIQTFNLANPSTTLQTFKFTTPFTLTSDEYFAFAGKENTGKIYYYSANLNGLSTCKLTYNVEADKTTQAATGAVSSGLDIGYIS